MVTTDFAVVGQYQGNPCRKVDGDRRSLSEDDGTSQTTSGLVSSTTRSTTFIIPSICVKGVQIGQSQPPPPCTPDTPKPARSLLPSPRRSRSPQMQQSKRVKRGFREPIEPKSCGVIFESSPAWLWALRLSEFSSIWIHQANEMRLRHQFMSTWTHIKDKILIVEADGVDSTAGVDVWFLSGSQRLLETLTVSGKIPTVMWLHPWGRRKPVNSQAVTWTSLTHSQVGGVTNISGVFGVQNLAPVSVYVDPLTRTISHVVKYSERPTPCSPDDLAQQPHYVLSDRLSLHHLERTVLMPTTFSRTGWGHRPLVASELGHAFELPPYVEWTAGLAGSIVPIQLLRVVVDHVLSIVSCPKQQGSRMLCSVVTGPSLPVESGVFLPAIRKWLPGSWADVDIADRAVKADNARIDFSPWNRRISLVLPCGQETIARFESFALKRWRQTLYRSFLGYLRDTYGSDWQTNLTAFRSGARKAARAVAGPSSNGPTSKRRRVGMKGLAQHTPGGLDELQRQEVWPRQEGNSKEGIADKVRQEEEEDRLVELGKDVDLGRSVLSQALSASWWDWTAGSSLVFWRWNGREQIHAARDGMEIFIQSSLPRGRRVKEIKLDAEKRLLVAEKIGGMLARSYLEPGFVTNALHYFAVPKGETDIRVVFDGTSSGLNETLWAPNFYLPTARDAALHLSYSTWMLDMDCGEMFHNFFMDKKVRKCAGLQVTGGMVSEVCANISGASAPGKKSSKPVYLRWSRLFMGMRPSPYNAVRHYYWAEEFARGDPGKKGNPMAFDRLILNLPGMVTYNPSLPKVMKWNSTAHSVAGDVITFVDDVRVTGFSKENCRDVHRQFASRIQFLGMQDAPRKFRPPSQEHAGAWTGTIFRVSHDAISKSVSAEKWAKGTAIMHRLWGELDAHEGKRPMMNRKLLERETGFLNHLAMTFDNLVPFLKGLYLTLNSWRAGRDSDDWKVSDKRWGLILEERFDRGEISKQELEAGLGKSGEKAAPEEVKASPKLVDDVKALTAIFNSVEEPPRVNLRSKRIVTIIYGFGDASGSGLGATFTCGTGFTFRVGVWGTSDHPESSNWKEFTNIVESLEEEGAEGNLGDSEVFMFTDNSTVEACAAKGSSTSQKLLDLVIRLQALSTRLGVRIHIFHVAGTRMIAQGTDGVSRGFLGQGVMAGDNMRVHIPIYLSAVDRTPADLVTWIRSWTNKMAILLDPMDWYQTGHDIDGWRTCTDGFERPILTDGRVYIWAPPAVCRRCGNCGVKKSSTQTAAIKSCVCLSSLVYYLVATTIIQVRRFCVRSPSGIISMAYRNA